MAQHSLELPSHHTKQEMHKFPAFSLVEQRGRGVRLSIPLCTYERKEEQNSQEHSEWKHKSTVSIHAVWGQSLGFWECLRMFIAVLQHLVGQSQNPLQQAQWKKNSGGYIVVFHFDIVRMLLWEEGIGPELIFSSGFLWMSLYASFSDSFCPIASPWKCECVKESDGPGQMDSSLSSVICSQ